MKKSMAWRDLTDAFSEDKRRYKDTYLEINEIFEGGEKAIELSLFSRKKEPYEIFFSYGKMFGVIYAKEEEVESKRQEIKKELEEEYRKREGGEPSREFVDSFCEKHGVDFPIDTFCNFELDELMDNFDALWEEYL